MQRGSKVTPRSDLHNMYFSAHLLQTALIHSDLRGCNEDITPYVIHHIKFIWFPGETDILIGTIEEQVHKILLLKFML